MSLSSGPFLSVIVPTHGRPEALARCLNALTGQRHPADRYEVIVVDDGAAGPQPARIEARREGLEITLLRQERAGPATARNRGAARARGELLVFTDDDCAPAPDWLGRLARAHAEEPRAALGGRTVNAIAGNAYSETSQLLIDYLYGYFRANPSSLRFVTSNNLAVPTEGFREVGGFEAGFPLAAAEDRDFCDRWLEAGRSIRTVPEAIVAHHHRLTLSRFLRQHFGYGRGAFQFQQARAQRGVPTPLEPPGFYAGMFRYPFERKPTARAATTTALLFLTQAANAAGFFWERWTQRAP